MSNNSIDWESIYNEYRTGQHSNRAIASKYGTNESTIRTRAKKEGWKKDLIGAYQVEVETQLIEEDSEPKQDVTQCAEEEPRKTAFKSDKDREKDRDVVKDAAKIGAEVVREHRRDIRRLKDIASKIGKIVEGILSSDKEERAKAQALFADLTSHTETVTDVARKLTSIHSECIKLERTAFNLDKKEQQGSGNTDIGARIKARMDKLKSK